MVSRIIPIALADSSEKYLPEKFLEKYLDISEIGSYNGLIDTKCKSSAFPPAYSIPLYPNTLSI
jgi:hypothetical protein